MVLNSVSERVGEIRRFSTPSAIRFLCDGLITWPFSLHSASIQPTAQMRSESNRSAGEDKTPYPFRDRQIVELAADRLRENVERIASVERKDLRSGVAEPLRRKQAEKGGLAGTGRPADHRVSEIPDVQIEPKGVEPLVAAYNSGGLFLGIMAEGFSRCPAQTAVIGSRSAIFSVCRRLRRTFL